MDFSIITPSFNYGHYIGECLESVACQTGVTFEHLVMDAGSTDETENVVRGFPHAHLHQEADGGMSDGINKGFRRAKGRWVMWLNADDRLTPHSLSEVKRFSDNNPAADVIYGCWDFIDANGEFLRRMSLFPFRFRMLANYGCYIASTSTFFRRETTIAEGCFLNENFKAVMDCEYYCRLAESGKMFEYLPVVLAEFRLHDESISQRHLTKVDIDGILGRQLQLAESSSIRRMYGARWFRDEMTNRIVEGVLYHMFRMQKGFLRWRHRKSCRLPNWQRNRNTGLID
jgi:glycosyltransferase involved in cell wall biosynthesis